MKTVTSAALIGAEGLIKRYHIDPAVIARLADIDMAALTDPDLVLDAQAVLPFFEIAAKHSDERYFGIELGKCQGLEILGSA